MSLFRLNHGLPRGQTHPEAAQGTAEFHHQIPNALLPQTQPVFDDATALHTAVDVLDPQPTLMQRLVGQLLFWRELLPTGFLRRHEIETVLQDLQLPYCVASSGPREKIELSLYTTGLLHYFQGRIFSAYEVGSWKPAPGLFLHAAHALSVPPERCAVIEDSVLGVQAGRAAGMTVFGYAPSGNEASLAAVGAHPFTSTAALLPLLQQDAEHASGLASKRL